MRGVDWPDEKMQTALHHAALGGHHEVVQFFVDCGADTEAVDDSPKFSFATRSFRE